MFRQSQRKIAGILNQLLWEPSNNRSSLSARKRPKSQRSRSLRIEFLERREVFSVAFLSGISLGVDSHGPEIRDNAVDSSGNQYIAGYIGSSTPVDFDSSSVRADGSDILTSRGGFDAYVAKYGPNNEFLWVRGMGGDAVWNSSAQYLNQIDRANDLAIDASGNVIVSGEFVKNANFGATTLVTGDSLYVDPFVTKLDPDGNFLWARSWGSLAEDRVEDVAIDSSGNIIAVGFGNSNAEIRKYSPNGSLQWSKGIASSTSWGNSPKSVAIDHANNIIVSGDFAGIVDFNPDPKKTYNVSGAAAPTGSSFTSKAVNAFVLKLNSAGTFQWVAPFISKTSANSQSNVDGDHVAVDLVGNIYLAGDYKGQVDVNPATSVDTRLNASHDALLVKISSTGILAWHQTYSGSRVIADLKVSGESVLVGGSFSYSLTLPGMTTIVPMGELNQWGELNSDIYFAEFNLNGGLQWTAIIGGAGSETLGTFDVALDGTLVVVGTYLGAFLDFDNDPSTPPELQGRTNTSSSPKFLVRLRRS